MVDATTAPPPGGFPVRRLRRLRRTPALRRLVAEARLEPDDLVAPLFVREGIAEPVPIASMPGEVQHSVDSLVVEAKRLVSLGVPGAHPLRRPGAQGRPGQWRLGPEGHCAGRAARRARRSRRPTRPDGRPLSRRVHRSRALRHPRSHRRSAQRPDPRALPAHRTGAGRSRGGRGGAQRHDGRPGGGHPRRARRRRPPSGCDPRLRVQVRVCALRPFPGRGRRGHRRGRRPPRLPAGPAQRARGAGGNRAGRGRGRRHDHGEAGHDVSRRVGHRALAGRRCRWRRTT